MYLFPVKGFWAQGFWAQVIKVLCLLGVRFCVLNFFL